MDGSVDGRRDGVIPTSGLTVLFNPPKPFLESVLSVLYVMYVLLTNKHCICSWFHRSSGEDMDSQKRRCDA